MPTRNVNLTDHFDRFVDANIQSGHYKNASEVVRDALRLLELRQQEDTLRLKRLREAVDVGNSAIERGDYRDVDVEDLNDYLAGLGETSYRRKHSD